MVTWTCPSGGSKREDLLSTVDLELANREPLGVVFTVIRKDDDGDADGSGGDAGCGERATGDGVAAGLGSSNGGECIPTPNGLLVTGEHTPRAAKERGHGGGGGGGGHGSKKLRTCAPVLRVDGWLRLTFRPVTTTPTV
jgi:hypothetical protein